MKPSRSDEILSPEDEEKTIKQVQQHFEALAPKRAIKPGRSEPFVIPEYSSSASGSQDIPEHLKLMDLEARSEPLVMNGGSVEDDTYLENEYYKDLIAAENGLHHTTGTGFINISGAANAFQLVDDYGNIPFPSLPRKCNPATNDWIPSPILSFPESDKPRRSDP